MTETIVKVTEDYETGARSVLVMPRQEASERLIPWTPGLPLEEGAALDSELLCGLFPS